MISYFLILTLITLTQGDVPDCSKFMSDIVQEQERVHPETDVHVKGMMNATLNVPNVGKTADKAIEWRVEINFSREVDQFEIDEKAVNINKTLITIQPQSDKKETKKQSILTLPFALKYTGGSPLLDIINVNVNDISVCAKQNKSNEKTAA